MKDLPRGSLDRRRLLIVIALLGAATFAVVLGYEEWVNNSFPAEVRPFADYASVNASVFNGTEYAFTLSWHSAAYLPLFSQLTSTTSESANTPVCEIGLQTIQAGQRTFLPFRIHGVQESISDVDLTIAVKPVAGGNDFSIIYHVDSVNAVPGDIIPRYACSESNLPM